NCDIELAGSNGAVGHLELRGNLNLGSGVIQSSSTTSASFVTFAKNGSLPQNVTRSDVAPGGFSGRINYTVNLNSFTNLGEVPLTGCGSRSVHGRLGVGSLHPLGAIQQSGTGGNIQVPAANRDYRSTATIVYNGAGHQNIGNAFPFDVSLEIDNPAGV